MKVLKKITAAVLAAACITGTFAFSAPDRGEKVTVIVEMKGDAVLEAKTAQEMGFKLFSETDEAAKIESDIKLTQAQLQSDIKQSIDGDAEIGYTYTHVLNGFSMEVYPSDIDAIKALPEVENVTVSQVYELDEADSTENVPYLDSGCEMMHTEYMHEKGYTGKGMVIAIIDGGFDTNHENFKGEIENPRLSKSDIADKIANGRLSINSIGGNATVNRVYRSEKIPYAYNYYTKDSDTYDITNDHGMHVAGIAAGNNGTDPHGGKFVGTAPDAQLLFMGCGVNNSIYSEASLAALDDAVKLGADVINASFGGNYQEEDAAEYRAINTLVNAGIMVSTSAGNSSRGYNGANPRAENIDYSACQTPGGYTTSTSVASVDNTDVWQMYYEMTVGGETVRFGEENKSCSFAESFAGREYDYEYAGFGRAEDFNGIDVRGKIALMQRGENTFAGKVANAKNAGAIGAIMINTSEQVDINITQSSLGNMPTATVAKSAGEKLKAAEVKKLRANNESKSELSHSDKLTMSSFSSWGTNSTLELKPEITAPGGDIYSSTRDDKYENKSGTSMSTPHMTGASALMKEYIKANSGKYGDVDNYSCARLIENLIMTSADVIMQDEDNNIPYSPRVQGAGLVNLEKAAKTPVTLIGDVYNVSGMQIEKSKISLKEIKLDENGAFNLKFKARNLTDTDVTYDSIKMSLITDSADKDGFVGDMKELKFDHNLPSSVTVAANGETEISVAVTPGKTELEQNMEVFKNGFFIDGFVFLSSTANDEIPEISIPFTGFYGDWSSAPALDKPYFSGKSVLGETYMYTVSKRLQNGSFDAEGKTQLLGKNWFCSGLEEDYNDYNSEDFVGYSPNSDGEADIPSAVVTPLRRLGKNDFSICDSDGKVIVSKTDMDSGVGEYFYANKFKPTYLYFDENVTNALPDGDYFFKSQTGFLRREPYDQNESVEFKFYLDREKPVITKYEMSEDKNTLTVAATDNRHLMGFVVSGIKNNELYYKSYPIKGLAECKMDIDISGMAGNPVVVEVVDYAQNSTFISDIGLSYSSLKVNGSNYVFTSNNYTGEKIDAAVTMALYSHGELVGVCSKDETIPTGTGYLTFYLDNVTGYDTIKLFVWDSLDHMMPMYGAFEF